MNLLLNTPRGGTGKQDTRRDSQQTYREPVLGYPVPMNKGTLLTILIILGLVAGAIFGEILYKNGTH